MQHFTRRDMIMLTRITMAKEPVCKPFEKKNTTAENNNEWGASGLMLNLSFWSGSLLHQTFLSASFFRRGTEAR